MKELIEKYYAKVFELAKTDYVINLDNIDILATQEEKHGFVFPEAIKAWYAIDNREDLLNKYASFDSSTSLSDLTTCNVWSNAQPEDTTPEETERIALYNHMLKTNQLIGVFGEHQGMVQWYFYNHEIRPDPGIWVYFESLPNQIICYPGSFSELIYLNIWEAKLNGYWDTGYTVSCDLAGFSKKQITFLQSNFGSMPTTDLTGLENIERKIHRFEQGGQMLAYWEQTTPKLILYGDTLVTYKELLDKLINEPVFQVIKSRLQKEYEDVIK